PATILHQRPDSPPAGGPRPPAPATTPVPGTASVVAPPADRADPDAAARAEARLEEARAWADRGDRRQAERLLDAALEADPLLAPARELRAHLLLEQGDDEGAEGELRAALFLDPALAVAHATLGAVLARRGERSRAAAAAAEVRRLLAGRAAAEPVPG